MHPVRLQCWCQRACSPHQISQLTHDNKRKTTFRVNNKIYTHGMNENTMNAFTIDDGTICTQPKQGANNKHCLAPSARHKILTKHTHLILRAALPQDDMNSHCCNRWSHGFLNRNKSLVTRLTCISALSSPVRSLTSTSIDDSGDVHTGLAAVEEESHPWIHLI